MSPLWLYRIFTDAAAPLICALLRRRLSQGKEDSCRVLERRGIPSLDRPGGRLIWVHAASVGEAQSSIALIKRLLADRPDLHVLQTTGTLTSARLMKNRLPERSFHQFAPVDRLSWVKRFLDHWRPDLALWMESEIWPNLVLETARRSVPSVLVNARMSERSYRRWRKFPRSARQLLRAFSLSMAQTEEQANYFQWLGADPVKFMGNLKFSAAPLPVDNAALSALVEGIAGRPIWLAASTHPGEEEVAAIVHKRLVREWPDILTIAVPRHPARGEEVAKQLQEGGFSVSRRSLGEAPAGDIYLGDTLGELGLFYRLAKVAFIGGSMAQFGGHNPLEAAQLKCAVVLGPDMGNFAGVAHELMEANGAIRAASAEAVADSVAYLLRNDVERNRIVGAATEVADKNANTVERVHHEITLLLDGA